MVSWRVPLERLVPGQYVLRVTVTEGRSRQRAIRQVEFTIKA